ncbi:MAG: ferric reductase-like transmembrane domain-containing protein [Acidobacteriota bacterium]|nr:ferric reductase-like transmembrane domain-containing protein [Acidobacteriota bacterium]
MTRATGIVAMVLLSATVVLGITTSVRHATPEWPRFAWQDLHRRLSLLSTVFIGLHIATTVADGYAPIGWISALVPFTSPYRRLWLGLGTVGVDLLLAVGITSLLRSRIRPALWRGVHWLAYLCWPVALLHSLGTGTDPRLAWVAGLLAACVAAVVAAVAWRVARGWPVRAGARKAAATASAVFVVGTASWALSGPLQAGWAARAGTPSSLLRGTTATKAAGTAASGAGGTAATGGRAAAQASALPAPPYRVSLTGSLRSYGIDDGQSAVDVQATTSGTVQAVLAVHLVGSADGEGGLTMARSSATFGPAGSPTLYQGSVIGLDGTRIELSLADAAGSSLVLRLDLTISGTAVQGVLVAE